MADLSQVWNAIEKVADLLAGHTEKFEVGGSVRRCSVQPKDSELVVIPKPTLLARLDALVRDGTVKKADYSGRARWGEVYRGLDVDGIKVEIFSATPDNWGYIFWLRTGPGDANQYAVSRLWGSNIRAQGGAIWYAPRWSKETKYGKVAWMADNRRQVRVADENAMFALMGMSYIIPRERRMEVYERRFEARSHRWGDPLPLLMDEPAAPVVAEKLDQPRLF
jgi:DNA polymerase/3'-5' exonuclease PolX